MVKKMLPLVGTLPLFFISLGFILTKASSGKDEKALVESQIADSVSLMRSLDSQGDKPSAAVWHYFPDADEWRLLIAGPSFDALLPNEEARAYQRVAETLSKAQVSSPSRPTIGSLVWGFTTRSFTSRP